MGLHAALHVMFTQALAAAELATLQAEVARLQEAVHIRFGLKAVTTAGLKKVIKQADNICAWFEAVQLAGFSEAEADGFFGKPPGGLTLKLAPLPPTEAQAAFLARFGDIQAAMVRQETMR